MQHLVGDLQREAYVFHRKTFSRLRYQAHRRKLNPHGMEFIQKIIHETNLDIIDRRIVDIYIYYRYIYYRYITNLDR